VFTYTGELITKAIYTEIDELTYFQQLQLLRMKIINWSLFWGPRKAKKKKTYTYNANGTISTITVLIDPITLQETKYESSLLTLDANGNVIRVWWFSR
jgi:hypothetical protein